MPPQLEKNHVVPTSWQDEALARDGVLREVPCSALKGETFPDSLPATPKSSPIRRVPSRGTPRSQHHFICAPSPLLIATGVAIPLRGLEGVPGLPGAPQDEAGLTRKFETSPVCDATCRTTPISRSALDQDLMPGDLFEGSPVGEGTTRRDTVTPVHRPETPAGATHSSTRGWRPPEQLERQAEFPSSDKTGPGSSSQLCRDPAVGV